jgi:hypothetical protein
MSSYSGLIAMIQDVPVAISGLIALSLATILQDANPVVLFANIFTAIALATLLTGIAFLLPGYFKLGNLVRFIFLFTFRLCTIPGLTFQVYITGDRSGPGRTEEIGQG